MAPELKLIAKLKISLVPVQGAALVVALLSVGRAVVFETFI